MAASVTIDNDVGSTSPLAAQASPDATVLREVRVEGCSGSSSGGGGAAPAALVAFSRRPPASLLVRLHPRPGGYTPGGSRVGGWVGVAARARARRLS